jgi:short-subunit dehydrogenase
MQHLEQKNINNIVLTGASSGIGNAIKNILSKKYNVLSINSRLEDIVTLQKELSIINDTYNIFAVINCAGFGEFRQLEDTKIDTISKMIDVNLKAPIIITQILLKNLKKNNGYVINITSIEATRHSKFSASYTATKSGLRDFSLSLFEEVRKAGVKVTSINPDITNSNFFDKLQFEPKDDKDTYLDPTQIAYVIEDILTKDYAITDITIRPKKLGLNKK